ncbi:MAG: transposase [Kiritimatiellia bacterium]
MARSRRVESKRAANYHVVSRCNNRSFFFANGRLKDEIADLLVRTAAFSGVEIMASCLMDNHFHLVIHIPKPNEDVSAEEVIRRIGILRGAAQAEILRKRWAELGEAALESRLASWRRRMQSLREFVKTFKELVNLACKRMDTERTGTLFEGRYHSTLIEGGRHLAACIRYVEYNPIRAGIVRRATDYRWSTKNAGRASTTGLCAEDDSGEWRWLTRRVPQLSQGQVFGSAAFVLASVTAFGRCFAAKVVGVRPVVGRDGAPLPIDACSTHGFRLAGRDWQPGRVLRATGRDGSGCC